MKHLALFLILTGFMPVLTFSQDIIVKTNGNEIPCRIIKEDSISYYFTIKSGDREVYTYLKKTEISHVKYGSTDYEINTEPDIISWGFGLGLDYGGIGINLSVFPHRNIGIFGGTGFNFAGVSYNVGLKGRIMSKDRTTRISPFFIAMYGYNAVIVVFNSSSLNKTFFGPTAGIGIDLYSRNHKNYWTFGLLIPVRNQEVFDYIDYLEDDRGVEFGSELLPFSITLGFHFNSR